MMLRPATTPTTLGFGRQPNYPLNNGIHEGVDFAYTPDDTVYAPLQGTVIVKPMNGNDGNGVYMEQGDMLIGMCHLDRFLVNDGQLVNAGQPVGIMGDTGYADGKHLHFAVKVNGQFVDPLTLIDNEGSIMIEINEDLAELITLLTTGWPDPKQDGGTFVKSLLGQSVDQSGLSKMLNNMLATPQRHSLIDKVNTNNVSTTLQDKANRYDQIKTALN